MSFTEFAYQIFQAYDFLHLYQSENCLVQVAKTNKIKLLCLLDLFSFLRLGVVISGAT